MKMSLFILFLVCCLNTSMYAQADSYGKEFTISSVNEIRKRYPKVASLANGGFVVCWESNPSGSPISREDVFAQILDSSGEKIGKELQVNTHTERYQGTSAVVGLNNGGFVVCWISELQPAVRAIFGQMFDASGAKYGNEFKVNDSERVHSPVVVSLENGGFLVVWGGDFFLPIYGRLFDERGNKVGKEFYASSFHSRIHWERYSSVVGIPDGGFVVCGNSADGISGQIFDKNANKRGAEFQVNSAVGYAPGIVAQSDGTFKVFWFNVTSEIVHYQKFNANGLKIGNKIRVQNLPYISPTTYTIATFKNDSYMLCWTGIKGLSNYRMWGQRFDASGTREGYSFRLGIGSDLYYSSVSSLKDNSLVICWPEEDRIIKGKLFTNNQPVPVEHDLVDFSLVAPANDSALALVFPTFRWNQPSTLNEIYDWEVTFDLYIDTDANFSNPQIVKNIVDTTYSDFETFEQGKRYFWKVIAKNALGDSLLCNEEYWSFYIGSPNSVEQSKNNMPADVILQQNYPNPFNASTTIEYNIPKSGHVNISVYNILGEKVATLLDNIVNAGFHSVVWYSKDKPSGIYLVRVQFYNQSLIRKIVLQK